MTAGRVLVLIQVASLRSARQAHALRKNARKEIHHSRTEAELCAKPLAQDPALTFSGFLDTFRLIYTGYSLRCSFLPPLSYHLLSFYLHKPLYGFLYKRELFVILVICVICA